MISSIPGSSVNTLAPYAPMGRAPVSQETSDLKSSTFKATEQPADVARSQNQRSPEESPNQDAEQDRVGRGSAQGSQSAEQSAKSGQDKERVQAERQQIEELAARDREVRAHEQAHAAVAGQLGGSPSYTYQRGPDGVSYAVGGEVNIDTSPVPGDPEATLRKAQQIQRAASAPADPSGQDRQVAAQAVRLEQEARIELRQKQQLESQQQQESVTKKLESDPVVAADEPSASELDQREREAEAAKSEEQRFAEEQLQLDQRRARAELFGRVGRQNIDLNRRLIEIGVLHSNTGVGSILNQKV